MRNPTFYVLAIVIFPVLILASCNLPNSDGKTSSSMSDIQTEAAELLSKQETVFPESPTPTTTRVPATPTAYPTFHPELAVTATPAQPAVCPVIPDNEFSTLRSEYESGKNNSEWIVDAVSRGASLNQIQSVFAGDTSPWYNLSLIDLTNDGVPELVIDYVSGGGLIYHCVDHAYVKILDYDTYSWPSRFYMDNYDLNRNGIPEILISYYATSAGNKFFDVLEWNGTDIQSILRASHGADANETSRVARALTWNWNIMGRDDPGSIYLYGTAKMVLEDTNGDQVKEIIFTADGPLSKLAYYETGPWLEYQLTFSWNGESFLLSDYQIDAPYYRYQALQEADRAFLMRDYDQASLLYDKVVGSTVLEWYSLDRKKYFWDIYSAEAAGKDITAIPGPYFRADEYQYLSAYARFRKVMLLLAQGKQADAYYVYQLLDQIYTEQNPGFWHAEMGRIYWKAVEEGMSLTDACQPVIEYVEQNPKLLEALGDPWHGEQSHVYVAADVCPLDEKDVELLSGAH